MKNVSILPHARSPFWQLVYLDPVTRKRTWKSSGIRVDDPHGRRKVLERARDLASAIEAGAPAAEASRWELWVEDYFRTRYGSDQELTWLRFKSSWKNLREWLDEEKIYFPAQIEYKHAEQWVKWRTRHKRRSGTPILRNTALLDLKVLNLALREAMKRGFCKGVPTERAGLRAEPSKEKPEISAEQDVTIRAALQSHPAWMLESYSIAMAQGCRLRETQVPMTDVDEKRGVIVFDAKGSNRFATRLNPALLPIVQERRKTGALRLVELPRFASRLWREFFDSLDLPHHSFHCTRVTVITRMARAGVPIAQAMAYVGHANSSVHKIYQRLLPQDLSLAVAALSLPPNDALLEIADGRLPTVQIPPAI